MQRRSLRSFGEAHYSAALLEAAVAEMGTMDARLILHGTYLVAELDGRIVGSAGWTMRAPSYTRLLRDRLEPLDGTCGMVRGIYVDPAAARQGVARRLLGAVEAELRDVGAEVADLLAALSCAPFYAAAGYARLSDHVLLFGGCLEFPVQRMCRRLRAAAPG